MYILWFCILSTSFVCATCIIFMFTQCTPVASIFNPSLPHTCYMNFTVDAIFSGSKRSALMSQSVWQLMNQGYTAFMDFALAIFPWFVLWKLNMKRKERLTVALGLSLGVL